MIFRHASLASAWTFVFVACGSVGHAQDQTRFGLPCNIFCSDWMGMPHGPQETPPADTVDMPPQDVMPSPPAASHKVDRSDHTAKRRPSRPDADQPEVKAVGLPDAEAPATEAAEDRPTPLNRTQARHSRLTKVVVLPPPRPLFAPLPKPVVAVAPRPPEPIVAALPRPKISPEPIVAVAPLPKTRIEPAVAVAPGTAAPPEPIVAVVARRKTPPEAIVHRTQDGTITPVAILGASSGPGTREVIPKSGFLTNDEIRRVLMVGQAPASSKEYSPGDVVESDIALKDLPKSIAVARSDLDDLKYFSADNGTVVLVLPLKRRVLHVLRANY